ncbi:DUF669 domain-containing protein [Methylorubrum sp. B1-46]|uniref:DUF669 domain-containing protein n=1 Tax=Methylorubrum sp. B1-46 TaxID=2897334 RepID=UPI001E4C8A9B|nr:DUF669 domain-containing protein [Methylorubrum sp. B1-46]UGB26379.1 DUF669 domain-containing protein [Methylorubrum sp. B1-46]
MADLGMHFNPSDVPEDEKGSFDPMPAGDYNAQIVESEIKPNKSGEMLRLTLEIIDGPFANRKVWDNLNIRNKSAKAQQIAQRALADICTATNTGALTDSEDLHFKPLVVTLKIEPERTGDDGKTYDARNAVKRYKGRSGQPPVSKAPSQAQRPQQSAQPARGSGGGSKPWERPSQSAARTVNHDDVPF